MKPPIYSHNRDQYWSNVEALRVVGLPANAFDFISIHEDYVYGRGFTLLSPLLLVDNETCKRPRFENRVFPTHRDAKRFALRLVRKLRAFGKHVHVVNCCGVR